MLVASFTLAGVSKLADQRASRRTLAELHVPSAIAGALALAIPLAELVVAATLGLSATTRWGAVGAAGLLAVFTVGIAYALLRGRRPDCRCFGAMHSSPLGWHLVLRNMALTGLAGLVLWDPQFELGVLGAVALAVFAAQSWLCYRLLRQNGRVLGRLAELEASPEPVLASGTPAPAFVLDDGAGGSVPLASLLARGRPVLLVFVKSGCAPCEALLPSVAAWQRRSDALTVAVVGDDRLDAHYGIRATPSAVVIGADGRIAHPVTVGSVPIVDLAESYLAQTAEAPAAARWIGGVAGVGVAAAAVAVPTASAADAERQAIRALLAKADRTLLLDAQTIVKAAKRSHTKFPRPRASVAAESRAIRSQRTAVRALRKAVSASPATTPAAIRARALVTETLQLLDESLVKLDGGVRGRDPRAALKSVKAGRKLFDRSLQRSVDAQAALEAA